MIKYDTYKDSGIEWLNNIPEHWSKDRIKSVFREVVNTESSGKETLLTVSHITGVTKRSEKVVYMFMAESMKGYKMVQTDDLIINTMWAWMGALGVAYEPGICSPAYNIYRPKSKQVTYSRYFDYLFRTGNFIVEMTRYSKGIVSSRLRLYPKDFFRITTIIPPLPEQKALANYLDTKTQAIDKKVSLLEKKIDYYTELRISIINDAVTKGLDKDVELKDSGIDWIGQIPKHWEVRRLKELGNVETSSVNKKIEEDESIVSLVNYTDVFENPRKEIWNNDNYMKVSAKSNQIASKKLKKGDVLFTPSSETIEDIGVSAVVMENLENTLYSYHLLRLRFRKNVELNFKKYLFNNSFVQFYLSHSATGTTRKILGLNTVYNTPIVLPSTKEEQTEIAQYLDDKTSTIDAIITNIGKQIDHLAELRKTLINDVVTGKIKVA